MAISIDSTTGNKAGKATIYQAIIPTNSQSMDETVSAFGKALKSIYQSLLEDISKPNQPG